MKKSILTLAALALTAVMALAQQPTREQMEAYLAAGCDRIGTSAARILFDE